MKNITKEITDFTIGFAIYIHDRDAYIDKHTLKELFLEYVNDIEKEEQPEEND